MQVINIKIQLVREKDSVNHTYGLYVIQRLDGLEIVCCAYCDKKWEVDEALGTIKAYNPSKHGARCV